MLGDMLGAYGGGVRCSLKMGHYRNDHRTDTLVHLPLRVFL